MMMTMTMVMMMIYWEYPMFCVITAIYTPILSAVILIFTGLRIRRTLRSRYSATMRTGRRHAVGSRRTLRIITYTSVAYFACWGPYAVTTLTQNLVSAFKPPPAVQFVVMWLANANSAVNVFIYSATNKQFRRECVLQVSRLCCSRSSRLTASKHSTQNRRSNDSALSASNMSTTINVR